MNEYGNTIAVNGIVTRKETSNSDEGLVHLGNWNEIYRVGKITPASAVIELPKK